MSPTNTALEPARSLAKWRALVANAGLCQRRAARSETSALLASRKITKTMTASAHQVTSRSGLSPLRRSTASLATNSASTMRMAASASAARCSAFP
jgi:hypothetical protein